MHPWGGMIILSHAPVFSCGVRGGVGFMEYHSPTVVRLVDFFFSCLIYYLPATVRLMENYVILPGVAVQL